MRSLLNLDQIEPVSEIDVVVIGRGVAGLLTGLVYARQGKQVAILERDRPADDSQPRRGVPQSHHLHVLLDRGRHELDTLLPGIGEQLQSDGARLLDAAHDLDTRSWIGWSQRHRRSRRKLLSCTRGLFESTLRKRVLLEVERDGLNLTIHDESPVQGIVVAHGRVVGVRVAGSAASEAVDVRARLVVDASGRSSRTARWLHETGTGLLEYETIDPNLRYASCFLHAPALDHGTYIFPTPGIARGGVLLPVENGLAVVTVYGSHGEHPGISRASFREFQTSLASTQIAELTAHLSPLTRIRGFAATANRRLVPKTSRLPSGLLLLGDSLCAFNPVYGQGMTVAILQAQLIARLGERQADPLNDRFVRRTQTRLWHSTQPAWSLAVSGDRQHSPRRGIWNSIDRVNAWFVDRVRGHAASNSGVSELFWDVASLSLPRRALMTPQRMFQLMRRPQVGLAGPPPRPDGDKAQA
ncbi:FAD-dependent oxidoreductase [Agromyces sp. NPDC058126]|uniref:FAD-dependent oxidoreductase n=1 Tax=Agromyces sp. NPDC058126 TaxID=3346350 RepID=UPI0036DC542E